MQVNNSQPSFGSTLIKLAPGTSYMKYTDKIAQYFELKGHGSALFLKPQLVSDKIDFSQAAIVPGGEGKVMLVGKDGGPGGADTFIGRILKETFPNDDIVYRDDIAPIKFDGPVIDMTKLEDI